MGLAIELRLLKPLAIEEIKEQIKKLKEEEMQKPLNITAEFKTITTKVNI